MLIWKTFIAALEKDEFALAKRHLKKLVSQVSSAPADLSCQVIGGRSALIHTLVRIRSLRIKHWSYRGESAINRLEYRIDLGLFVCLKNGVRVPFSLAQQRLCAAQPWGPKRQLLYLDAIDCALALVAVTEGLEEPDEEGNTALLLAAVCGEPRLIKALVRAGANPAARNSGAENVLHLCAASGRADALAAVLKMQNVPVIDSVDQAGWTALHHLAAAADCLAGLKLLVKAGADTERRSTAPKYSFSSNLNALQIAQAREHAALISFFPKSEGPVKRGFDVRRALADADIVAIEKYLDREGDIEAADSEGYTLLLSAVAKGNLAMVSLLLSRGANINAVQTQNFNALLLALGNLGALLRTGAGEYDAAYKRALRMAGMLIEAGIDLTCAKKISDQNALHDAAALSSQLCALIVKRAANEFNNVAAFLDKADSEGLRALHHAARNGMVSVIKLLLDAGADVNVADNCGFLPLHEAILAKKRDAAICLIEKGSDLTRSVSVSRGLCRPGDDARTIAEKMKQRDVLRCIDSMQRKR